MGNSECQQTGWTTQCCCRRSETTMATTRTVHRRLWCLPLTLRKDDGGRWLHAGAEVSRWFCSRSSPSESTGVQRLKVCCCMDGAKLEIWLMPSCGFRDLIDAIVDLLAYHLLACATDEGYIMRARLTLAYCTRSPWNREKSTRWKDGYGNHRRDSKLVLHEDLSWENFETPSCSQTDLGCIPCYQVGCCYFCCNNHERLMNLGWAFGPVELCKYDLSEQCMRFGSSDSMSTEEIMLSADLADLMTEHFSSRQRVGLLWTSLNVIPRVIG